jgi:hypothetical protein
MIRNSLQHLINDIINSQSRNGKQRWIQLEKHSLMQSNV